MSAKEKVNEEIHRNLHEITVARTEEEVDELFGKTEQLITLRIFSWKARMKIREGI